MPAATTRHPPGADEGGLWSPDRRQLTVGLLLTITLVAFEALAVATVMPRVQADLGGLVLYGWVFSGFFLASILGIVVSGQFADRRGLFLPFAAGLGLFTIGLGIGGLATSMGMLVAARLLQGFGAGAIPAVAYVAISRGYPPRLRPRMFATLATAWVIPGLIGPGVAAAVEHAWNWRVVFLGLLPVVALAGTMALPALAALTRSGPTGTAAAAVLDDGPGDHGDAHRAGASTRGADRHRLGQVLVLVVAVGAVLAGTTDAPLALAVPLVAVGLPLAVRSFVHLVPPGTARLVPGVPATVAVRGILTCAFFAADAYLPLAIIEGRGAETWVAGAALSFVSVLWASGAWVQARLIDRLGPRRLDRIGFLALAAAIALVLGVSLGLPVGVSLLAWGIGGLGMGMAYAPLSVTVLGAAAPGEEGRASSALQLSDTLGIAVGTGIGGSVVAFGDARGWAVSSSTAVVFGVALVIAIGGVFATGRLPERVPHHVPAGT